jgi:single stranded DNA-binding protein
MSFLQLTAIGNVGQSPRSNTHQDRTVVNFSVACNRKVKGQKTTQWINVSCWSDRVNDVILQYVTKGKQVMVQGTPSIRTYKDNRSGETIATLELDISFGQLTLLGGDSVPDEADQRGRGQEPERRPAPRTQEYQSRPAPGGKDLGYDDDIPF